MMLNDERTVCELLLADQDVELKRVKIPGGEALVKLLPVGIPADVGLHMEKTVCPALRAAFFLLLHIQFFLSLQPDMCYNERCTAQLLGRGYVVCCPLRKVREPQRVFYLYALPEG